MVLRCSERKDIFAEKFTFADDTVLPVTPTNASGSQQQQHPIRENGRSSTEISNIRDDRPSRLGIPGSVSADVQPRSRVTSDSSAASVPGCTMPADPPAVGRAGISTLTRSKAPRDTHYFDTSVSYNDLQLPIRLPLDTFPDEIGEVNANYCYQTMPNDSDKLNLNSIRSSPSYRLFPILRVLKVLNTRIYILMVVLHLLSLYSLTLYSHTSECFSWAELVNQRLRFRTLCSLLLPLGAAAALSSAAIHQNAVSLTQI